MAKKYIIVVVVILILVGFYLAWSFLNVPRSDYITMRLDEAVETLLVSGRVVGEGAVPLSFKRPGQVLEVLVTEGDQVNVFDPIARLDDREAENLIKQSENNLNSAEIALERIRNRDLPQAREALAQATTRAEIAKSIYQNATIDLLDPARERLREAEEDERQARRFYEDQQQKFNQGLIGQAELNQARDDFEEARNMLNRAKEEEDRVRREVENLARESDIASSQQRVAQAALQSLENEELRQANLNVTQAKAQLDQARLELEQTRLEAPFPGVITSIAVSSGQYVAVGQEVCIIIPAASNTYVEAQVDEEYTGQIKVGQEVIVSSSAFPDRLFQAKVERVSPTVDPARGTFQARFMLDVFERGLLPDLAVTAEVVTGRIPDSLIVEQGLTFRENDLVYVLVADDGRVAKRRVSIEDLGRGLFMVTEGLVVGDRVLTDLSLEPGRRVRLGQEAGRN